MKKRIIGLIIVVLIAVGILAIGWWSQQRPDQQPDTETLGLILEEGQVSLVIEGVITEPIAVDIGDDWTALDVLETVNSDRGDINMELESYDDLGDLVVGLGEFKNGDNNEYWHYYVNGVLPMIGASEYDLDPGDEIEWKFEPSQL